MKEWERAGPMTPDLFAAGSEGTRGGRFPSAPKSGPYILPQDLPAALGQLSDDDLRSLAVAVETELGRRGMSGTRAGTEANQKKRPEKSETRAKPAQPSLTPAREKAVRAAHAAGVKPSMIARQFGVSLSVIRRVLSETGR